MATPVRRDTTLLPALAVAALSACAPPPSGGEDVAVARSAVLAATEEGTLLPEIEDGDARFGSAVVLTGKEAFIALPNAPKGTGRGEVYPYLRNLWGWKRGPALSPGDPQGKAYFGQSLSLSGDTLLVGAPGAEQNQGAAYVFVRDGESWKEQAKLSAGDTVTGDIFGTAVVLSGDVAVVGSPRKDEDGIAMGAVYLFSRSGSSWTKAAKISPPDGAPLSMFGTSLAVSGNTLLVGANAGGLDHQGVAHVYALDGVAWTYVTTLFAPDVANGSGFGRSVAIDGDTAVIGAPFSAGEPGQEPGRAFVFAKEYGQWVLAAALTPGDPAAPARFGISVSIAGSLVAVGAYRDAAKATDAGAVYAYRRGLEGWSEGLQMVPAEVGMNDGVGSAVTVRGREVLAGAPAADVVYSSSGAAYLFEIDVPLGEPCAAGAECTSGFCVGSVCCDSACDGPGLACSAAEKGQGDDGVCGPTTAANGGAGGEGGGGAGGAGAGGAGATGVGAADADERSYYSCSAGRPGGPSATALLVIVLGLSLHAIRRRRRPQP